MFKNNYNKHEGCNNITKNKIIATILSFVLVGFGNIYNGLYRRGIVEFGIAIMIGFILTPLANNQIIQFIILLIGVIWWMYVLYDTMECTDAINNNRRIPHLLNRINIK